MYELLDQVLTNIIRMFTCNIAVYNISYLQHKQMVPNCLANCPNMAAFMERCLYITLQPRWPVSSTALTKPFQIWVSSADCQVQKELQVHEQVLKLLASKISANSTFSLQPSQQQDGKFWRGKVRRCKKGANRHTERLTDTQKTDRVR